MKKLRSSDSSSPPSSEIGLGAVMINLLESRNYAREIVRECADPAIQGKAVEILNRLIPSTIRLAELGQIENFTLTDEERVSVSEKAKEVA